MKKEVKRALVKRGLVKRREEGPGRIKALKALKRKEAKIPGRVGK